MTWALLALGVACISVLYVPCTPAETTGNDALLKKVFKILVIICSLWISSISWNEQSFFFGYTVIFALIACMLSFYRTSDSRETPPRNETYEAKWIKTKVHIFATL